MPAYTLPDEAIRRVIKLLEESRLRLAAIRERRARETNSVVKEQTVNNSLPPLNEVVTR